MIPEDSEKILNRIKKLFALAGSANRHEAKLALEKAHDLLDKYNLHQQESGYIHRVTTIKAGSTAWIEQLGMTVAAYFDCELCFALPGKKLGFYYIRGDKSAALTADYGWHYVVRVCKQCTSRYASEIKADSHYIYKSPAERSSYLRKKLKEYRNGFLVGLSLALSKRAVTGGRKSEEIEEEEQKKKKNSPPPLTTDFLEGEKEGLAVKIDTPIEHTGKTHEGTSAKLQ